MSFFARAHYTSDTTQFLAQLKNAQPGLEQAQREGRALLWDQRIDRRLQADVDAATVSQQPYVYQTATDPDPAA